MFFIWTRVWGGCMKKLSLKKTLPLLLLLLIVGSFAFLYYSRTFNEQNLKAIDIQLINNNAISEANTSEYVLLSPEDKAHLALALASVKKRNFKQQQITHQYNIIIHNSWGLSRAYTVFFTEDAAVILGDRQENDSF